MSKTFWALAGKFVLTLVAAWVVFRVFAEQDLGSVFAVALAGTALNYVLGDLVILPRTGNVVAAALDGLLAALTAYAYDVLSVAFETVFSSLALFAAIVAVAEYFFHRYLRHSDKVAP